MKIFYVFGAPSERARATRRYRGLPALLVTASALFAATAQGQGAEGSAAPAAVASETAARDAQLEQAGATIRAINVTVDNVFDPSLSLIHI